MAFAAFLLAAVSLFLTVRMSARRELRSERVVLCDRIGAAKAALAIGDHGQPRLVLFDSEGRERLELAGPWFDRQTGRHAGPGLFLRNAEGVPRAILTADAASRLDLRDDAGRMCGDLTVFDDGQSALTLQDGLTGPSAKLSMTADGEPELRFHPRLAPSPEFERGGIGLGVVLGRGLFLYGDRGELRLAALGRRDAPPLNEPGLYLFDRDGKKVEDR